MSRFRDLFEGKEVKEEVFTAPPAQELTPPPAKEEVISEEVFASAPASLEVTEPETLSEEPKSFGM
mgnify:CR=1 FL=1